MIFQQCESQTVAPIATTAANAVTAGPTPAPTTPSVINIELTKLLTGINGNVTQLGKENNDLISTAQLFSKRVSSAVGSAKNHLADDVSKSFHKVGGPAFQILQATKSKLIANVNPYCTTNYTTQINAYVKNTTNIINACRIGFVQAIADAVKIKLDPIAEKSVKLFSFVKAADEYGDTRQVKIYSNILHCKI